MPRFLAILMLLLSAGCVYGQTEVGALLKYSQKNGLPSDEAYCVYKDSKEYIWIATDQGVVRHKGGGMEVIKGLPDNVIFKIREDRKGRIWFFPRNNKLSYYENNQVHLYGHNDIVEKVMGKSVISDVFISNDDSIHVNVWGVSNYIIDINTGQIRVVNFRTSMIDSSLSSVVSISRLKGNAAWPQLMSSGVRNWNQLVVHAENTKEVITYTIPIAPRLVFDFYGSCFAKNGSILLFAGNHLIQLLPGGEYHEFIFPRDILTMNYEEAENALYVGMKVNGVVKVDMADFTIADQKEYTPLHNKSVSSIAFDNEGGKWFTTLESGVFYHKRHSPVKITEEAVNRVHYYKDSLLLFIANGGLYQWEGDRAIRVTDRPIHEATAIIEDRHGNILIGCKPGKMDHQKSYYKQSQLQLRGVHGRLVYHLAIDNEIATNNGPRVFLSLGGFLNSFVMKEGKIQEPAIVMLEQMPGRGKLFLDNEGGLWAPAYTGLFKYDVAANKFRKLTDRSGVLSKGCNTIRQMTNGILVAGITSSGIALIHKEKVIAHITENEGLLSNSVRYILPVNNTLWLAMSNGISVIEFSSFDPLRYRIINLSENTGLKNLVIHQLAEHNGNIMIPSNQGLYTLENMEKLLRQPTIPIPLYITRLSYNKGDTSGITSITLPYHHNQLTVDFDAISYNAYSELQYYYRLFSDSDTTWHNLQTSQIVLGNLTPGNYKLQIKAELPKYGRRSDIQELDITIEKPWWQWNVVRLGALLLFLLIVFYIYNRRVKVITRREKEKTAIQTEMAELKQVALRSQMNPHFIFNCLASIQQLVVAGSRDEANEYLVKFSRLIRKTLELSIRSHISLAEEKEYISEYLELEQLRIPGQFDFYFTIDKDINTDRTEIPNMMLQPIVENCVRHGIKHLENRKGVIDIRISRFDGYLRCEVTDNGVGRKEKSPGSIYAGTKSFGLGIVEKRLTGLAGYDRGNYFIKVIDNTNKDGEAFGTKVILQLPLKTRSS
jgi:ligand-binding sensor domain-containing protein